MPESREPSESERAEARESDHEKALAEPVFCGDRYMPFGELGPAEARRLSSDLKAAGSWGPMSKVGAVALAWRELADRLEKLEGEGTATVASPVLDGRLASGSQ